MKRYFHSSVTALAMTAMVMSGVVVTAFSLSAAPAFSKNDNANSNSNSNSNSGRGNSNRNGNGNGNSSGATASSFGALNAAHANANALANAAKNSRVGMIEIYKTAVGVTADAKLTLESFIEECDDQGTMVGESVDVEVDGVTQSVPYCDNLLAEAAAAEVSVNSFNTESYITFLEGKISDAAELENIALEAAANNKDVDSVIEALWDLLEIDGYE